MKFVIYRRPNGSIVKYEQRAITKGSFTRYGIFDNGVEIVPEDRQERFIKYSED